LENIGLNERIILEWILRKYGGGSVDWMHLAQNRNHDNKTSDYIKGGQFLE
jgi:hypothetical protein